MKNLFFGLMTILASILMVSCSQTDLTQLETEYSQEDLTTLRTALENSEELKALRATNEAFVQELRNGKVELFELFDEINAEGISLDCQSLNTHETRLKGLEIFKKFTCDYNDHKSAIHEKFEVLSELDRMQMEFVFGHEADSRGLGCTDVFIISMEFYDLETAVWAFVECCKDEFIVGCIF